MFKLNAMVKFKNKVFLGHPSVHGGGDDHMDMYGQRRYKDGIDSKMIRDQILISSIVSKCHIQACDDSHCTPRDVPLPHHRLLHRHEAPGTAGFQGL